MQNVQGGPKSKPVFKDHH